MLLCALACSAIAAAARGQEGSLRVVPVRPLGPPEVRVTGRIVPLQTALVGARVQGRIAGWGAVEGKPIDVGSRVAAGAELFSLERAPFEVKLAAQKAAQALAEAQLADLLAGTRPERIAALEAVVSEIDVRLDDLKRQEERYRRLVENDRTVPARRLEEVQEQIATSQAAKRAAAARIAEAKTGATATEIAIARARVAEAASQAAILELDLKDATVRAPFDGVVTKKLRGVGDYVNSTPFVEVLEITSDRDLEAELRLSEAWYADLHAGATTVTLSSPLLPAPIAVPFTRVVGAIDRAEGVFTARAAIPPDKRGRLVPGAFVEGVLPTPGKEARVLVPAAAVLSDGEGSFVLVARDGRMARASVAIAERLSDGVVVRSGVSHADKVVVGPPRLLVDGSAIPAGTPGQ
jgi:multidrug efflux pump subunit AcrA (membrane-fusion protein)